MNFIKLMVFSITSMMLLSLIFVLIQMNEPYSTIQISEEFKGILNTSEAFYNSINTLSEQGSANSTGGFWSGLTSFVTDNFLFKAFNMVKNLLKVVVNFYDIVVKALSFVGVDPIIKYWIFGLLMISAITLILRLISRSGFV